MTTDNTHRLRARDAIDEARRMRLTRTGPNPAITPMRVASMASGSPNLFTTAQENSIEVYDDKFGRNTILTRSARMRKFRFYQYKPVTDSPSTPKINHRASDRTKSEDVSDFCSANSWSGTPKAPTLLPREDVIHGKTALVFEQSKELVDLDNEIAKLEKQIAEFNKSCNSRDVDYLDVNFALVNKKNDLIRRQMQLNIIEQEKVLEKANEELTKELRSLINIDDSKKTKAQMERQQYLYEQSLALVNKRNELVHHMDVQERGIEDDNALKATLKDFISDSSTRSRLSRDSQEQNCVIQ